MLNRQLFLKNRKLIVIFLALFLLASLFAFFFVRPVLINWYENQEDVSISTARISVRDMGEGSPTVIIINGMARHKNEYKVLQEALSVNTRVVSYDRPGLGYSGENSFPRTLDYIAEDLAELVQAIEAEPPFILIGHSLGGHIARYYADRHPEQIAGLVFLDHPHEDWFRYIRSSWSQEEVEKYFSWWSRENRSYTGVRLEELLAYETNGDMVRGVEIDKSTPVLMITGKASFHYRKYSPEREIDQRQWAEMQGSLLVGVEDAKHIVDQEVGHWPHWAKPEFVAEEIAAFIENVRAKESVIPVNSLE